MGLFVQLCVLMHPGLLHFHQWVHLSLLLACAHFVDAASTTPILIASQKGLELFNWFPLTHFRQKPNTLPNPQQLDRHFFSKPSRRCPAGGVPPPRLS